MSNNVKMLTIVDCYIHNEESLDKLNSFLNTFDKINNDILLISIAYIYKLNRLKYRNLRSFKYFFKAKFYNH